MLSPRAVESLSTEELALKIRGYVREARRRKNLRDFYTAGVLYNRAARWAVRAKRTSSRYETQALNCFEKFIKLSLGHEDYSKAADAMERMAKIYERNRDTETAADLRIQASYLRLKGIETLMA